MHYRKIHHIIAVFLLNSLCLGNEYYISVLTQIPPEINPNHWKNNATNSALEIEDIEIDVFQWKTAAESRESVQIEIINSNWEFASWAEGEFELPEVIDISILSNFRGTPTINICVTPWRIMNGKIEALTQGEIHISLDPVDFPITYNHPFLLNGEKRNLQQNYNGNIQYLIICPSRFGSAAQSLADMHSNEVSNTYQLNTEVITTDIIATDISGFAIRDYIIQRINNDLDPNGFLLLFGDEIDLPPIYNDDYPSDDFYSTFSNDIFIGDPQLVSGRIPVSTEEDAWTVVEKIRKYTLQPTPGIWRSKIALVADDMYKSCLYKSGEDSHTLNSDVLYDSLITLLSIQPFYGVHYDLQQNNTGCEYPDLTADLIRTIHNGVALINYIGHGSPETWADERIITKSRDLPLIQANNGKLAIWIAGTCSFGKYHGENSFMEELLVKKDGAIAIVATTDVVGYTENSNFLENFFGLKENLGIQNIIREGSDLRLGELILNSKNGNYHKFHTFGDPALRLPFPKYSDYIIETPPTEIPLISEANVSLNAASEYSTLLIRGSDKEILYSYDADSLTYTIPGITYAQMNSSEIDICFRIPLDADVCEQCAIMQVFQDDGSGWNTKIQTHQGISITSLKVDFKDNIGPKIKILQEDNSISDGSALISNLNLIITLNDTSGINLMGTIGHGIQYKFDDDYITQLPGSEFVYEDCDSGSASIPIPPTLSNGFHRFYMEAWDGVNNKSAIDFNLKVVGNSTSSNNFIDMVFPIPNPFSEYTDFTMLLSNPPADITITIYTIMGEKVKTLDLYEAQNTFISIPWDGKDQKRRKIANGTYFYHLKAEKDGKTMFEGIFKLAKVE
jgi:hypothetical protein